MAKQNFASLDSLKPVERVLNEANEALGNESFTINDTSMPEVLACALSAGAGASIGGVGSFAALTALGTAGLSAAGITSGLAAAGGGVSAAATGVGIVASPMVAGIAVLAAPAVVLGAIGAGVGVGIASSVKHKKLLKEKLRLYPRIIETLAAIVDALKKEVNAVKERADILNGHSILLTSALKGLKEDLEAAGKL